MTQLSAVILTKNEEENITECLKGLAFCDEILIIDDYSRDKTTQIAKASGATIFKRHLDSDFSAQRSFGTTKAKGKWVLFVDADERVSKDLANEITQVVNDPMLPYGGFYLRRIDEMWGRRLLHGECGTINLLRLVLKGKGTWKRPVHETYSTYEKTYNLKNPLMHYPHKTLKEFISDVDDMSTIHAKANREEGKHSNIFKIMFWPPAKFIYNYFFKLGFRDGTPGFVVAAVMSFHSYLAWSKLWLMQRTTR